MTFGILPVDFREKIKRYLEDNAFRDDAILGSVDVEGGKFVDPGGTVHTGSIGGGGGDPGNVLGGYTLSDTGAAVHPNASSQALGATAIGDSASADSVHSTAVGEDSHSEGQHSIALGDLANADGHSATAIGSMATADDDSSVAIGPSTESPGPNAGRIGVDQLAFGASAGSIPDSEMVNGEVVVDADESNSQFQLRYKDSSGNIQTGTISFD